MPVSDELIGPDSPMGAALSAGGATFRTWAPAARDVYLALGADVTASSTWTPDPADRLFPLGNGTWAGFVPGTRMVIRTCSGSAARPTGRTASSTIPTPANS